MITSHCSRLSHRLLAFILLSGLIAGLIAGLAAVPRPALASDVIEQTLALQQASLVLGTAPSPLIEQNAARPMIPASTMKLVTALAAIERWGLEHRFTTELLLDPEQRLWIRGSGDPYLVSEELDLLAQALARQGLTQIRGLGLDDRLYPSDLAIPGRSNTNNPYDAPISALAANFNTVSLSIDASGINSGEPQTPLTATGARLGAGLPHGRHRLNLSTREQALAHFAELLGAKLAAVGIQVSGGPVIGTVPEAARPVYRHANSRTLESILSDMLKYSNNFVANNLFLLLGQHGGRASFAQSQQFAEDWAGRKFGWRAFRIEDGAGLSRGNRLSGAQLVQLLDAMAAYRALLPQQDNEPRVQAKTGTLSGVSAYAGFVERNGRWVPFSLLINQPVAPDLRLRVARALITAPTSAGGR